MKKHAARIAGIKEVSGKVLHIAYSDGRLVYVDMNPIINEYPAFAPLSDPVEFATAAVADWGWSVEWRCGATLDADRVFELSLEQAGMSANVEFRHWQDKNHLSLTAAAEAIGLTRRSVSQYRTGARPVSRTVYLACKGWEMESKAA